MLLPTRLRHDVMLFQGIVNTMEMDREAVQNYELLLPFTLYFLLQHTNQAYNRAHNWASDIHPGIPLMYS